MHFGKIQLDTGAIAVVAIENAIATPLSLSRHPQVRCLAELLAQPDPIALAVELADRAMPSRPIDQCRFLPPVDRQEVWAAGVTYQRSKVAREEESAGASQFYDKVYTAARPELFLKATAERVVGPKEPIAVRADSKWNVPEPELTLVISPDLRIVGYTIGNDVSSRDIEGENPLYLPQAKIYRRSCAIGPWITPAAHMPARPATGIDLSIHRDGTEVFRGQTTLAMMARSLEDLVQWLGRELDFPNGVLLLTGTGIV
ncbi:MAG: fumarylacetoacetate hydrolase family protein, partial [Gemmataceae bacterium]